ncbi:hypothetical protein Tco_1112870 [Tanacetum coccineum]|uniref:Uncharacterized protein n=1 Tax=Tanacetum coccineum TaxID=301880 RepID=A0ABQ5IQJ1_9ASTR
MVSPEEELVPKQEIGGVEGLEKELAFSEVDDAIVDVILDDLLQNDFNKQECVKDDIGYVLLKDDKGKRLLKDDKGKLTGIKFVDDLEKKIPNVEEVLYKAKEEMLMKKEVIKIGFDTSSDDTHPSTHPFQI